MRLIGTLFNQSDARRLSAYLTREAITNRCEPIFDAAGSSFSYQVWVADEDQIERAHSILTQFQADPANCLFNIPGDADSSVSHSEQKPSRKAFRKAFFPITFFFLALCIGVYVLNWMQSHLGQDKASRDAPRITQIETALFFDLPPAVDQIGTLMREYRLLGKESTPQAIEEPRNKVGELAQLPRWEGFYPWLVLKIKTGDGSAALGPMFVKIGQGEIWRLFSPSVLHRDFLHILFNLVWLWSLSRAVEEKIGSIRLFGMTLVLGIATNTAQYLMSGFYFMGYSGVIAGLAGFIWMREKVAPWEGYPIQKTTLRFLGIFVFGMLCLQIAAFLVQIFSGTAFTVPIANTAHISGILLGAAFGRTHWFVRRIR